MLNKSVKDIQSLRDKKRRDETGLFVAEGPKIVGEMIAAAPGHIEAIYALENWAGLHKNEIGDLTLTVVDNRMLERLSHLQAPNEVIAMMRQFAPHEPTANGSWVLYLDAIQDPGNMGTIIRLADWFGVPHLVCTPGCADVYNPKVVQSTMASLARINIWMDKDGSWIKKQKAPLFAAALNGTSLYAVKPAQEGILMIGNESKGLHEDLLQLATQKITIPKRGGAESLNAAVATGIILAHLTKP